MQCGRRQQDALGYVLLTPSHVMVGVDEAWDDYPAMTVHDAVGILVLGRDLGGGANPLDYVSTHVDGRILNVAKLVRESC
jgi:hypothetical protein